MRKFQVALLPGDGIGPEVMDSAVQVLEVAGDRFGFELDFQHGLIGQAAIDAKNNPLPIETIRLVRTADGVLLGPVAGPRWGREADSTNPKHAIYELHGWLGVYANLRPIRVYQSLLDSSTLRPEVIQGVDLLIVRDVSSGLFYGQPRGIQEKDGQKVATNTIVYSQSEIERVTRKAFESAMKRRKHLVLAHWSKILETGRLWREIAEDMAREFPEVRYEPMDLDTCILELTFDPRQFDVILADISNGDLLSAQAAAISGTFALHPSAVIDGKSGGLFSPGHGSAPDLVGKGMANPTAAILAASMMVDHAFKLPEAGMAIREAVDRALEKGARTCDICPAGVKSLPTKQFTERVIAELPQKLEVPPIEAPKSEPRKS